MANPATPKKNRRFKLIAICLGLMVGLVVAIGILRYYQKQQSPQFFGNYLEDGFEPHPYLGYAPKSNTSLTSCKVAQGDTLYCATYSIDSVGRRQTLHEPSAATHIMLFGCSFTYGEGVNDYETFAYHLALMLPYQDQVYNYGYSGYGPQQMLAHLQFGDLKSQVPQQEGTLIYTLLPEHVNRAAAAPYYLQSWGAKSPHYALEGDSLVYYANHYAWRFWYTGWHRFLGWSGVAGLMSNREPTYTEDDIHLTVAVIKQSQIQYLANYPKGRFVIAIPPFREKGPLYNDLVTALRNEDIEILDLTNAYPIESTFIIEGDGHPNANGHAKLAKGLFKLFGAVNPSEPDLRELTMGNGCG